VRDVLEQNIDLLNGEMNATLVKLKGVSKDLDEIGKKIQHFRIYV
jgi:hypothetical protein